MIGLTAGCASFFTRGAALRRLVPQPRSQLNHWSPRPATLESSSTNSTAATICGPRAVAVEGKQEVRPSTSATDELVADCAGGSAAVLVTVSVMALPPPGVNSKSFQVRLVPAGCNYAVRILLMRRSTAAGSAQYGDSFPGRDREGAV